MNILVTGGAGYIGSHTVVEHLEKGYHPFIADNLSNSRENVIDAIFEITGVKVPFIKIDLCNKKETENIFDQFKIDATIHFAAWKAVGESVEDPLKYYRNNLLSLITLLEIYKERNLDNFVFSSSCSVYGQADKLPVTETSPLKKPESPYGNTKQIGEEIITQVCNVSNINSILLRYFNPIGAHSSAEIGELPIGVPQNLIPYITQTGIGLRKELSVYGNDYPTPDGTCIRDYIHVVDLAKAHIIALQRLLNKKNIEKVETFNLGTGTGSSILEVIKTFEKVSNTKLPYKIVDRRDGDVVSAYANTDKANEILGWKAQSTLEESLASAWKWEMKISKQ